MAGNHASERRWLLPSSRKLRNLESISLRNLQISLSSSSRSRGTTIDDDALPLTLNSPAKLLALREEHALGHSRSLSDLRGKDGGGEKEKEGEKKPRPAARKLRRRSTIEWANATPQSRQQKLEAVTRNRLVDVFFTLHVLGVEEPVYVSEMMERTMNPTFGSIDWEACGPGILRWEQVIVRVWTRRSGVGADWVQLLQLGVEMRGLWYLGKSLATMSRPLPSNAVLFHLPDGIYTTPTGSISDFIPLPTSPNPTKSTHRQLPASSFDALLRLSKLCDSIQDALTTRNEIASSLESLLQSHKQSLTDRDTLAEATDRLKTIEFAKSTVSKQLTKARAQAAEKRASLAARRKLMASDLQSREISKKDMQSTLPLFPSLHDQHTKNVTEIQSQRRRICEDIQICYPILPLEHSSKTLDFSIRGLRLPNSTEEMDVSAEHISAALGYVAHILQLLSFYLGQALPYPVHPRGSTSGISDPISILKSPNTKTKGDVRLYPLFSKGVPRFRSEYAVFLLSQDVRVLVEGVYGLRVMDVRQTLPNLKFLLVVGSSGEGEIAGRKRGGVRGLMGGRRGSEDSVGSSVAGRRGGSVNGRGKGAVERLREISGGNEGGGRGRGKGVTV